MQKDTQEELERLERELLEGETVLREMEDLDLTEADVDGDDLDLDILEEIRAILDDGKPAAPAFDDPQTIHEPEEPLVYCNYSNDYGRDLQAFADDPDAEKPKNDWLTLGLMITASALTLGIIAVLIYWLVTFL